MGGAGRRARTRMAPLCPERARGTLPRWGLIFRLESPRLAKLNGLRSRPERKKRPLDPTHQTRRREPSAPSQCNVEWVRAGPDATGMCVYFATGDVSPKRHDPPSTNFAKRGRRARRILKECTFMSLGTDPDVQDNIEH